ncbi:lanthionine synthetase LanC family protein [Aquimarina gracilis]|uniref:Lanthionine synthetase LanC family protein n=1 Tax=Aquimarina gracilis TaxID=874422 RepID=A0ABU6A0E8_9FLAO|nr:lanthionine synthetase LanC family protein [Aquimarina gracilis]MEB3347551.1 lanthionine synthetase LanC family protein [Aquimarina gracilis]
METTAKILTKLEDVLYTKAEKVNLPIIDEDLGVIIFFATLYNNTKDESYKQKALQLFNKTVKVFADHELNYSMIHGFEGIFWTVNYLYESNILENEDILANLEPYLLESIEYDLQNHNYNILHGCLGKIQYYLYSKSVDQEKASNVINRVIQSLYNNRIEENGSINWKDLRLKTGLNIGFFNGHPAVLKFLVRLKEFGYQNEQIDEMINKLVDTLLQSIQQQDKKVTIRGKQIKEGDQYYSVIELHGNLTLAYSLYYTGLVLNREDLKEIAYQLTLEASSKDPKNSGIMYFDRYSFQDVGMSHGLGGVTYLLFKLNNWMKDSKIKENIAVWEKEFLKNTDKILSIEEKILMPEIFQKDHNEYPYDKYSLLDGILGSGLVISSLHYNQDNWGNYLAMY